MEPEELKEHKRIIDTRIKEGIDRLMKTGDVKEEDFFPNEQNDKMIAINDEEGVTIIFNYTKGTVYSYGGRLNED